MSAYAQFVVYEPIRSTPPRSQSQSADEPFGRAGSLRSTPPRSQSQSSSQIITTTAYAVSGDRYVKSRIRVQITGSSIKVVEIYEPSPYGAQWKKISYGEGFAKECHPSNFAVTKEQELELSLESQFMYKAHFILKNWYFDL